MQIEIYTDGACSGNPGKGGYASIMRVPEKNYEKQFSDGYRMTTNNRMELMAVIESFKKLNSPQENVIIYTDSKYVSDAINKNWIQKWQNTNFKNIKNQDLWEEFIEVSKPHQYTIQWIKGHDGNALNERADRLAVKAIQNKELKVDKPFEDTLKNEA